MNKTCISPEIICLRLQISAAASLKKKYPFKVPKFHSSYSCKSILIQTIVAVPKWGLMAVKNAR